MQETEFLTEMNRLFVRFGTKRYPKEVCEEIWNNWRDLSSDSFKRTVTNLISTKPISPLAGDFISLAKAARQRLSTEIYIETKR